tara:strand:+ start:304 stop:741 length:438 start_codon:yes stop_codon:yes gene_type:complete
MFDQIQNDVKTALKNGEKVKANTLRLVISKLKNKAIEVGSSLDDKQILQVIQKTAKQHKESIRMYKDGNREDLVEQEQAELDIVEKYLPSMMSEEEVNIVVESIIQETGATTMADFGKVMPQVMKKGAGKIDGSIAQSILKSKLS